MNNLKDRYKGISSSSLHKFDISPKLFKLYIDKEIEEEVKAYLELGIKLHMYLLEPDEFKNNYIYLEFDTPSSIKQKEFCEELVKLKTKSVLDEDLELQAYKKVYSISGKSDDKIREEAKKLTKSLDKYIEYLVNKDHFKDIINYSTLKFLNDAKFVVNTHKKAKELLFNDNVNIKAENEQRILWEYPEVTINGEPVVLKSFLDRFVIDHENKIIKLIDLKTTSNISEFEERFENFKYDRQLALYWLGLAYYLNSNEEYKKVLKEYQKETYIVAIQTNMGNNQIPIECRVYPISEVTLDKGYKDLHKTLKDVAWHFENNKWEHTKHYYENNGLEKTL